VKFTDLFIRRPVLALVISALLLLLGLQASSKLEIRQFPQIEKGVITVTTVYPGASPSTVEGFVTTPLQRQIASARGVEYITSTSQPSVSTINVHIRLGENTSGVLTEVIAKVNEARYNLPRQIIDPVVSTGSGDDAMIYLAFTSDTLSMAQITDYLNRTVQPELSTVEGVGSATIFGDKDFSMRVWLNPEKMAAYGVTAADINQAISRENYISTAGTTKGDLVRASVDAKTDMRTPEEFADLVVRQEGDRRVRLTDVAEVELAAASLEMATFSSGIEAIFVGIKEAPGANPLDVAAGVHEAVDRIEAQLPADMKVIFDWDASIYIDQALSEVIITLLEAALIVIVVIYLFLGSLRVVLIPLIAIPLSLIGVLFLIYSLGFSINLLTLLAMVIAIGLVVDDAIVVVENIHRHIENGLGPVQAALKGARQVALPVVAMTLTLAAVYAPIGFLGGLTGTLFSEFALTLAGAVLVSGVVALTLSPMMCAYLLRDHDHQGGFADRLDLVFGKIRDSYQRMLRVSLSNRGAVILFAAIILISLPLLFFIARQELAPEEDTGGLYAFGTGPQYANLNYLNGFIEETVDIWKQIPEISSSWQLNSPDMLMGGVTLVPWDQRERSQFEIQEQLQEKYSQISGVELFVFNEPALPGASGGLPVNFVIASTADYSAIKGVTEEVVSAARASGLFAFITETLRFNRPEINVTIDRDKAASLGISMQDIGDTLAVMLGEGEINRFSMNGRSYKVIPQASRDFRLTKEWLARYYLRTHSGELVPLSTVITLKQGIEPNLRRQYQQLNSSTIQGMMMPPNTLGDGLAFLEKTLLEVAPSGYRAGYEGESRRFIVESGHFAALFAVSLLLIYLVLSAQFNSFRDPFVVLISVPMSIFGAVVPIALGFVTLNIYTQVGLLTLIGLITKHGILIVDFANQLAEEGQSRRDAVLHAAALRLRPILMTTAATVLGVLPLLMASGAGANSRFGIGLMIAAGMLVGTLFTLFVVPVVYLLLASEHHSEKFEEIEAIGEESLMLQPPVS
jgi:hydrophobe/amphiphile efflux-1 (HAE1) family protein